MFVYWRLSPTENAEAALKQLPNPVFFAGRTRWEVVKGARVIVDMGQRLCSPNRFRGLTEFQIDS